MFTMYPFCQEKYGRYCICEFYHKRSEYMYWSIDVEALRRYGSDFTFFFFFLLCLGLTARQPLWVILCRLPEKGRRQIEEVVEEMKERDMGEGKKWIKVKKKTKKKKKKKKTERQIFPLYSWTP